MNIFDGSEIHTDEHKGYSALERNCFNRKSVCHKYYFINPVNGVNAQHVVSFNNYWKNAIKICMVLVV